MIYLRIEDEASRIMGRTSNVNVNNWTVLSGNIYIQRKQFKIIKNKPSSSHRVNKSRCIIKWSCIKVNTLGNVFGFRL